ncbi:hypothetical protein ACF0H5_005614 [Mactra antiquata]
MAASEYSSDLSDSNLETDHFDIKINTKKVSKISGGLKPEIMGKHSAAHGDTDRKDSGFLSGSSGFVSGESLSSEDQSLRVPDKTPIQCSDADEVASVDSIEEKLAGLNVNEDEDEAMYSMSSVGSVRDESIITQASAEEDHEIYIDPTEQDEDGDTVIHVAIVSLLVESALVLIELCEDIFSLDIQNNLRQSPLHLAVLTDQTAIVKALVAKGVDVTLRDQQGNTPLHIACRRGNNDAVSAIVKSLPDLKSRQKYFSVRNNEGLTCMHLAVQSKAFIILGHLFAKGADVNIGDAKSGRTMLHYAVENKDLHTVSLLLTHKDIDVDCKTFKGESPIVLAFWRNYQDIVKKLRVNGAYFDYSIVEDSDDEFTP